MPSTSPITIDAVILEHRLHDRRNIAVPAQPRQADGIERIAEGALDAEDFLDARVGRPSAIGGKLSPAASPRSPISEVAPPDTVIITTRSPCGSGASSSSAAVSTSASMRVDQRHAVLAEQRRKRLVAARERAGMGERRTLAEFAAAELEHDHRLLARGALDRRRESAGRSWRPP